MVRVAFEYAIAAVALVVVLVIWTRKLWIGVARTAVQRRRIDRLEKIQEAMRSYVCPLCGRSDVFAGVTKGDSVTLECRNCHHIWTAPARE